MAEYIEREATLKLLQNLGSRDYRREKGTICDAIKMIMHPAYTPTADVVEARYGRFVDRVGNSVETFDFCGRACDTWGRALYSPIYCSECYSCLAGMNDKLYPHQRNYCPNCGAKMDGKGEGE